MTQLSETIIRTSLNVRLDDAGNYLCKSEFKLEQENNAYKTLITLLDYHYLNEIQYFQKGIGLVLGELNISELTYTVVNGENGIIKVKITDGAYAEPIDVEDYENLDNSYSEASIRNPKFVINENKIKLFPTSISSVDVLYLRYPDDMTEGGDCLLNYSLKEILVSLAEIKCRINGKDFERATALSQTIYREIEIMNNKFLK